MGISKTIKEKVLEKGKGKCSICGRRNVPLDIEHITPISKGGTDSIDNLRAVCRSCHVQSLRTSFEDFSFFKKEASQAYQLEEKIIQIFRSKGFAVLSGVTGPDGGVDLVARGNDPISDKKISIMVECKWIRGEIKKDAVVNLASKVAHAKGDYGLLVINKKPSGEVLETARSFGISVVVTDELSQYLEDSWGIISNE